MRAISSKSRRRAARRLQVERERAEDAAVGAVISVDQQLRRPAASTASRLFSQSASGDVGDDDLALQEIGRRTGAVADRDRDRP